MKLAGYECKTTFWMDFSIAESFGELAVVDTYKRAFRAWKKDVVYLTELVMVLNHKIWEHHGNYKHFAELYDTLWRQASEYAETHLKGDDLRYYLDTTD